MIQVLVTTILGSVHDFYLVLITMRRGRVRIHPSTCSQKRHARLLRVKAMHEKCFLQTWVFAAIICTK